MTFPNFAGKHASDSVVTPADFIAYLRERGANPVAPEAVVMIYSTRLLKHVLETEECEAASLSPVRPLHLLTRTDGRVGVVGGFGIGAPAAVVVLEELIAAGTKRVLSIGLAGALQRGMRPGDVTVCTKAVRDEGVSHHYVAAEPYAFPSDRLTDELRRALAAREIEFADGASWTIDAPYRETVAEARHYQDEDVLTVEMEASALFTVGACRGVDVASGFVISDSLAELVWEPQFHSDETNAAMVKVYEAAVDAATAS